MVKMKNGQLPPFLSTANRKMSSGNVATAKREVVKNGFNSMVSELPKLNSANPNFQSTGR